MDALYNFIVDGFRLSSINTALLGVIFILAKQRYQDQEEVIQHLRKRVERAERTLYRAGFDLLEME